MRNIVHTWLVLLVSACGMTSGLPQSVDSEAANDATSALATEDAKKDPSKKPEAKKPSEGDAGGGGGGPLESGGAGMQGEEMEPTRPPTRPYTYYADAKPVIDAKCVKCHVENGIGPMPLTTYEEVAPYELLLKSELLSGSMPPWSATDECGEYVGDRSLTDEQLYLLVDWIDQGIPEGDPDDEGPALPDERRALSRIDEMLEMAEPYGLPRGQSEMYQCMVFDWPQSEPMYITGLNIAPDNRSVVHHAVLYMAPPGNADYYHDRDAADPSPGYECFDSEGGVGGVREWIASYEPGGYGQDFPEGIGVAVEPGSTLILQMHYDGTFGNGEPDQSWLEFKLEPEVEKPAEVQLFLNGLWLAGGMPIPAGNSDVVHAYQGTQFRDPVEIHWADLHMHQLGKSGYLSIERSNGTRDCLVEIPDYDFAWQETYIFKEPKIMYPGDQLRVECHWDNSAQNQPVVNGQRLTPQDRGWGDSSFEEMCLGNVLVAPL